MVSPNVIIEHADEIVPCRLIFWCTVTADLRKVHRLTNSALGADEVILLVTHFDR